MTHKLRPHHSHHARSLCSLQSDGIALCCMFLCSNCSYSTCKIPAHASARSGSHQLRKHNQKKHNHLEILVWTISMMSALVSSENLVNCRVLLPSGSSCLSTYLSRMVFTPWNHVIVRLHYLVQWDHLLPLVDLLVCALPARVFPSPPIHVPLLSDWSFQLLGLVHNKLYCLFSFLGGKPSRKLIVIHPFLHHSPPLAVICNVTLLHLGARVQCAFHF